MKRVIRWLVWSTLGFVVRMRLHGLLSIAYCGFMKELAPDSAIQRSAGKARGDVPTLLVLSFEQFRGDIEDLAQTGQVRILCLSEHWLTRLMFQFYPVEIGQDQYLHYFNPTPADVTWKPKKEYRNFLREFLPRLLKRAGVDIVVGHHMHYIPDFDWGAIADDSGYPYLVINRENLFATDYLRDYVTRRISRFGKFEGHCIAVHNEVAKRVFSESSFFDEEDIHILGCIRMDKFVRRFEALVPLDPDKTVVTMFTYLIGPDLAGEGTYQQCKDVHRVVIDIARENPDIEVHLKIKPNFYTTWKQMFDDATADIPGVLEEADNLHLSTTEPAQDLIERSNVVIGFNSTTVLEAAIANRHVIVPFFGPLRDDRLAQRIYFRDKMHLFNVPSDNDDLKRMIFECLGKPNIDDGLMAERRALFEELVSPLDASATDNHIRLIKTICREHVIVRQSDMTM